MKLKWLIHKENFKEAKVVYFQVYSQVTQHYVNYDLGDAGVATHILQVTGLKGIICACFPLGHSGTFLLWIFQVMDNVS